MLTTQLSVETLGGEREKVQKAREGQGGKIPFTISILHDIYGWEELAVLLHSKAVSCWSEVYVRPMYVHCVCGVGGGYFPRPH